jgi:hypothetical protein
MFQRVLSLSKRWPIIWCRVVCSKFYGFDFFLSGQCFALKKWMQRKNDNDVAMWLLCGTKLHSRKRPKISFILIFFEKLPQTHNLHRATSTSRIGTTNVSVKHVNRYLVQCLVFIEPLLLAEWTRVARFFLIQQTKSWKIYQNDHKIY